MISARWLALSLASCALAACGDDKTDTTEPLPKAPQALPNPTQSFVTLPLTEAGDSSTALVTIVNGGQDDLVIATATLDGDTSLALGDYGSGTVKSRDAVSFPISFEPASRGAATATLHITSNAQNLPDLTFFVIAPASASPVPEGPDIAAIEATAQPDAAGLIFARFVNLGGSMLEITDYTIEDEDSELSLPSAVFKPSAECAALDCPVDVSGDCEPVRVGSGALVALPISFTSNGGDGEGVLHVTSSDPDTCILDIALSGD